MELFVSWLGAEIIYDNYQELVSFRGEYRWMLLPSDRINIKHWLDIIQSQYHSSDNDNLLHNPVWLPSNAVNKYFIILR